MARIIPNINSSDIENFGERLFYEACEKLSNDYTVLYSFQYRKHFKGTGHVMVKEADFVILHRDRGFITVEVKNGEVGYANGQWFYPNDGQALRKNPVKQATEAYYGILKLFKQKSRSFTPKADYCIAFPQCSKIQGQLPPVIEASNVFLEEDLLSIQDKIDFIFEDKQITPSGSDLSILLSLLEPTFNIYTELEAKINTFNRKSELILTEEQERILSETIENRMVFLGGAGTGKTFIAIEKAKQLASQGKKVLLTCYSRKLPEHALKIKNKNVYVSNFHDFISGWLEEKGFVEELNFLIASCEKEKKLEEFYETLLPDLFIEKFSLAEEEKFDAIIVDEGQDFTKDWLDCLELLLKTNATFYIFADERQNIFKRDLNFDHLGIHRRALTKNFRNTEEIHNELKNLTRNPHYHSHKDISVGQKVKLFSWTTIEEQIKKIKQEIGRLVSQGITPGRVLILSPNRKNKSSLKKMNSIKTWNIATFGEADGNNTIKFDTIRTFKGLEADIVFLIDIRIDEKVCSLEDIYVGASRAKYLLYIFKHEECNLMELPSFYRSKRLEVLSSNIDVVVS